MNKEEIINNIHTLVSNNVIGDKQLFNRYKGFKTELELEEYIENKYHQTKLLDGGIIISKNSNISSLINSIYVTITDNKYDLENFSKLYSGLCKLKFEKMFLVFYEEAWKKENVMIFENEVIDLPVPQLQIFEFEIKKEKFEKTNHSLKSISDLFPNLEKRERNKYPIGEKTKRWLDDNLIKFQKEKLTKIYMNRLLLDGYIGFSKSKGKMSDIDLISKKADDKFRLIEIKEKDLPKRNKKGFGLDIPRLEDMKKIESTSRIKYHLIVKHINNQSDRKLINWKQISIANFDKNVKNQKEVLGGTGMRSSNSINPTKICDFNLFRNI